MRGENTGLLQIQIPVPLTLLSDDEDGEELQTIIYDLEIIISVTIGVFCPYFLPLNKVIKYTT